MAANFTKSKASVTTNIADNNVQAITASKLRQTLNEIITDAESSINTVEPDLSPVTKRLDTIESDEKYIVQTLPKKYEVGTFRGLGTVINGMAEDLANVEGYTEEHGEILQGFINDTKQIVRDWPDYPEVRSFGEIGEAMQQYTEDIRDNLQFNIENSERITELEEKVEELQTASKVFLSIVYDDGNYRFVKDSEYNKVDWRDPKSLFNVVFSYYYAGSVYGTGNYYFTPNTVEDLQPARNNYFAYCFYSSYTAYDCQMKIWSDHERITLSGQQPWQQYT